MSKKSKLSQQENENLTLENEQITADAELKLTMADRTAQSLTNRKNKKIRLSYLFMLLTIIVIVIVAVVEFSGEDKSYPLSTVLSTLGQNWIYLVLTVGCMLLALVFDGLRQAVLLRGSTGKWRLKLTFKSMILGKYFDSVTPSAFGGQPYQIYYLHKNKVPAGVATSLPVVCFFLQQFAFLILIIFSLIYHSALITSVWLKVAIYFGSLCMVFIPITIMIFAFIPKTSKKIMRGIISFLHKLRIVKNVDAAIYRFNGYLDDYNKSLKTIGKHKKTLLSGLLLAIICQLLNASIAYFVVMACGAHDLNWFKVVSLVLFTNAACAFIPTPGSSGAAEGFFLMIFNVLKGGFLFWGMILWRLISFYFPILIGIGVLINNTLKEKSYKRRGLLRESASDDDAGLVIQNDPPAPSDETEDTSAQEEQNE